MKTKNSRDQNWINQIAQWNSEETALSEEIYELAGELETELDHARLSGSLSASEKKLKALDSILDGALAKAMQNEAAAIEILERAAL